MGRVVPRAGLEPTIHEAANEGNIEAVKKHLAAGADVNARNSRMGGTAPMHWAATKEIAELLITNGADVNAKNKGGFMTIRFP